MPHPAHVPKDLVSIFSEEIAHGDKVGIGKKGNEVESDSNTGGFLLIRSSTLIRCPLPPLRQGIFFTMGLI